MKIDRAKLDVELVKRFGFYEFTKLAFPLVIQNEFIDSEHIRVICEYCEEIYKGSIKRGVINIPPASSKSTIISILFPVWCWIKNPTDKICTISYSPDLAVSMCNKSLELIQTQWFKDRWPHIILKNHGKIAKGDYWNTAGGRRFATSIGSKITGYHFDKIFADDPLKAADKKAKHQEVIEFFKESLPTRLIDQSNGKIVLIMQRLKPYDVSDFLLNEMKWDSLILPMEFDPGRKDPRDYRKNKGEILNPRLTQEALERLKISLGENAHAQLSQDPKTSSDNMFKKEYLDFINKEDVPQSFDKVILSLDPATYAKESSDYSAFVLVGKINKSNAHKKHIPKDMYYIIDSWKFKLDFADLAKEAENLFKNESKQYPNIKMIIEDKSLGPSLVSHLSSKINRIDEFKVGMKSKLERAYGIGHLFRNGQVKLSNVLSDSFKKEVLEFPDVKNDDCVDAMTQALSYISDKPLTMFDLLK